MFQPYNGYVLELKRALKADGRKLDDVILRQSGIDILCKLFTMQESKYISVDGVLVILELIHYMLSHKVVYVSTPLAQRLMESEITVNLGDLHIPFNLFEMCFDDDLVIMDGFKAPSALVLARPDDAIIGSMRKILDEAGDKYVRKLRPHHQGPIKHDFKVEDEVRNVFSIRFKSPVDGGICHLNVNTKASMGEPIDKVIDEIGLFQEKIGVSALLDTEREIEKRIARIALGVICFFNTADPDAIDWRNKSRGRMSGIRPSETLLGSTFERVGPSWHLRRAHWRFLKHERYKRDGGGSVRCVWVRAAEVGSDKLLST
jgi:hypothetical protein